MTDKNHPDNNYPDTKPLPVPEEEPFDVVFAGEGPHLQFVEVERTFGHNGVKVGEWWTDDKGHQRLTIVPGHEAVRLLHEMMDKHDSFSLHYMKHDDPYMGDWVAELPEDRLYAGYDPAGALRFALEEEE